MVSYLRMGVHTLGRAKVENSGYHGWWSDPENSRRLGLIQIDGYLYLLDDMVIHL